MSTRKNVKYTYKNVKKFLKRSGCTLQTPESEYKNIHQRVKWTCKCGQEQTCSLNSHGKGIFDEEHTLQCRSCSARKAKGGISYQDFVNMIEKEGWEMLSEEREFTSTKVLMRVRLPSGTETTTSWNRFKAGHRSKEEADNAKRNVHKNVEKEYAARGFKLLDTYIDAKTSMRYVCKCGRETKCSYNQLLKNKTEVCYECARKNKRVEWEYVEGYFDKAGCTLVTVETEYLNNTQPIEYICWCGRPGRTAWKVFRRGTRCYDCGIEARKKTNLERYGVENVSQNEGIKQKIKDYFMREYGVDSCLKLPDIRAKIEATNIEKYGYKYAFATPENLEKAREAHFAKYGVRFGTQCPETKEKIKKSCKETLGVEYPLLSKEVHKTIRKNNKDKYGNEVYLASDTGKKHMKDKYGHHVYIQSETGKKYMKETYGAEYAMQCPELFRKMQRKAYSTKSYTLPSGKVILVQGYENKCMDRYLVEEKYSEEDIVMADFCIPYVLNGVNRKYYPDIYIKSENKIIEVKSTWTYKLGYERNIAKWKAAVDAGYEMYVEVYSKKGLSRIEFINDNLEILFEDDEPEVEDYVVITLED